MPCLTSPPEEDAPSAKLSEEFPSLFLEPWLLDVLGKVKAATLQQMLRHAATSSHLSVFVCQQCVNVFSKCKFLFSSSLAEAVGLT